MVREKIPSTLGRLTFLLVMALRFPAIVPPIFHFPLFCSSRAFRSPRGLFPDLHTDPNGVQGSPHHFQGTLFVFGFRFSILCGTSSHFQNGGVPCPLAHFLRIVPPWRFFFFSFLTSFYASLTLGFLGRTIVFGWGSYLVLFFFTFTF